MRPLDTSSANVILIGAHRHHDGRGWFSETYAAPRFGELGIHCAFPQDNQSWTRSAGTVRGLHFQQPPFAQAKLVSCVRGRVHDCIVDVRVGSPTYGHSLSVELTDAGEQLFIPAGFAHGFMTLTDDVTVSYKVSALYNADAEMGVAWNDPALAILWPRLGSEINVSERDQRLPPLADVTSLFRYDGGGPLSLTRV